MGAKTMPWEKEIDSSLSLSPKDCSDHAKQAPFRCVCRSMRGKSKCMEGVVV